MTCCGGQHIVGPAPGTSGCGEVLGAEEEKTCQQIVLMNVISTSGETEEKALNIPRGSHTGGCSGGSFIPKVGR